MFIDVTDTFAVAMMDTVNMMDTTDMDGANIVAIRVPITTI